jgi:hypothetical protein
MVFNKLFGGGGGTPKYLKKAGKRIMDTAFSEYDKAGFRPYDDEPPIAAMNNVLSTAINRAGQPMAGQDAFDAALAQGLSTGQFMPTPVEQYNSRPTTVAAAPTMTAAAVQSDPITARDVNAGTILQTDIDAYMNPYLRTVIDATMTDLNRDRARQRVADRAMGAGAGAFTNDPRMQVYNAETTDAYDRNTFRALADLYSGGYDRATALATQDLDRGYNAAVSNADRSMVADKYNLDTATQNAAWLQDAATRNQDAAMTANITQAELDAARASDDAMLYGDISKLNTMAELEANSQGINNIKALGALGSSMATAKSNADQIALAAGAAQQEYDQLLPSFEYGEFIREVDNPYKRMGLLTSGISSIGGQRNASSDGLFNTAGNFMTGLANLKKAMG